jgi:hypothetical protein
VVGVVTSVPAWDAIEQRSRVRRAAGPSFLNGLAILHPGQAVWIEVAGRDAIVWRQS